MESVLIYCLRCKAKKSVDARLVSKQTPKGTLLYMYQGNCPDCNSKVSQRTSKPDNTQIRGATDLPVQLIEPEVIPPTKQTQPEQLPEKPTTTEIKYKKINGKPVVDFDENKPIIDLPKATTKKPWKLFGS